MPGFAPVLGKLFKMGKTAVITPPPDVEEKETEKMTMTEDLIVKTCLGHIKLERKN